MAIDLERKVKAAYESGHATWMPLLGSWMVCFACLRHIHLERSVPIYATASTVHCYCRRGKQARGLSRGYAGSVLLWMALGHVFEKNCLVLMHRPSSSGAALVLGPRHADA